MIGKFHISDDCWLSWQNLTSKKPLVFYGRAWLHLDRRCVRAEWKLFSGWPMLHVTLGGGDAAREISIAFSMPLLGFFFMAFDGFIPEKYFPHKMVDSYDRVGEKWRMPQERVIGFSIVDGYVFVSLWENPNEWNRSDPWWWKFSINPVDKIFGHEKYTQREISASEQVIELPEASYAARVKMLECTWKRPRWPFAKTMIRAEIEPVQPIPAHAGKGENSYDLDDDFSCGMTCPASTPSQAARIYADSIMRSRKKYGLPSILDGMGYATTF